MRRTAGMDRSGASLGDDACELDTRADAELAVDVAEVGVDRVMGKEEPGRGLAIRQAPGNEVGHAAFTLRPAAPPEGRSIGTRGLSVEARHCGSGTARPDEGSDDRVAVVDRFALCKQWPAVRERQARGSVRRG